MRECGCVRVSVGVYDDDDKSTEYVINVIQLDISYSPLHGIIYKQGFARGLDLLFCLGAGVQWVRSPRFLGVKYECPSHPL